MPALVRAATPAPSPPLATPPAATGAALPQPAGTAAPRHTGPGTAPAAPDVLPTPPTLAEVRPFWATDPAFPFLAPPDPGSTLALSALPTLSPTAPPFPSVPLTQIAPLAIAIATDPGTGALDVALSPDELGPLHLHVTTEGDTLRIALTVERPDTLDLLRRHADQLLSDLRQAGFGGATLSFGQGTAGDGRTAATPPRAAQAPMAAAPDPAVAAPTPAFRHGQTSGNAPLDLRL